MELFTRKQAAALLGVSPETVKTWQRNKVITPACYVRNRPRYSADDVSKLFTEKSTTLKTQTNESNSGIGSTTGTAGAIQESN